MTERLSRFTPNAAGLDRDAILFEAGRRSARTNRLWPALASLLVISNALTLFVLWPGPPNAVAPPETSPQNSPDLVIPPASPPPGMWSAGSQPDVVFTDSTPSPGPFVSPGPTLTVGSSLRFDDSN